MIDVLRSLFAGEWLRDDPGFIGAGLAGGLQPRIDLDVTERHRAALYDQAYPVKEGTAETQETSPFSSAGSIRSSQEDHTVTEEQASLRVASGPSSPDRGVASGFPKLSTGCLSPASITAFRSSQLAFQAKRRYTLLG